MFTFKKSHEKQNFKCKIELRNEEQVLQRKEELNQNIDALLAIVDIVDDILDEQFIKSKEEVKHDSNTNPSSILKTNNIEDILQEQSQLLEDLKAAEDTGIFEQKYEIITQCNTLQNFCKNQYFQTILQTPQILKDENQRISQKDLEKLDTQKLIDLFNQITQVEQCYQIPPQNDSFF